MSDDIWRRDDDWERKPLFGDDDFVDGEPSESGGGDAGPKRSAPDDFRFSIDEFGVDDQGGVGRDAGDFRPDEFGAGRSAQRGVARDEFETAQFDSVRGRRDRPVESMSFGEAASGDLPHWTEPATGQVPAIEPVPRRQRDQEPDVWASFNTESAGWGDDDVIAVEPVDASGGSRRPAQDMALGAITGENMAISSAPERISIGTDPSGMPRRPATPSRRTRPPAGSETGGRNLPIAIAVGFAIAAIFLGAILWQPVAVLILVTILLGLAAVEFFDKVGEKGYRPAIIPGILAVMAAPLTAYWVGEVGLPLVVAFALMAIAGGFVGSRGIEAGPLPNTSITMLGVIWIGLMGSFAALILGLSNVAGGTSWGTDTLVLLALGVVANDVGAYFIGSAAGRTLLRPWISPGKTVEGLIGGSLFTIVVLVVVGITERSDTWSSTTHLILLAIVIAVFAPLGDLVESMFKRNLDVKDFGTLVRGHGGVLDRFDGFLFTLPAVYYLTLVLEPWAA